MIASRPMQFAAAICLLSAISAVAASNSWFGDAPELALELTHSMHGRQTVQQCTQATCEFCVAIPGCGWCRFVNPHGQDVGQPVCVPIDSGLCAVDNYVPDRAEISTSCSEEESPVLLTVELVCNCSQTAPLPSVVADQLKTTLNSWNQLNNPNLLAIPASVIVIRGIQRCGGLNNGASLECCWRVEFYFKDYGKAYKANDMTKDWNDLVAGEYLKGPQGTVFRPCFVSDATGGAVKPDGKGDDTWATAWIVTAVVICLSILLLIPVPVVMLLIFGGSSVSSPAAFTSAFADFRSPFSGGGGGGGGGGNAGAFSGGRAT